METGLERSRSHIIPPHPLSFPLPSLLVRSRRRRSQGAKAGVLKLDFLGLPLCPVTDTVEPGPADVPSPAVFHHVFVILPLRCRLLPKTTPLSCKI